MNHPTEREESVSYQEAAATEVACRLLAAVPGMTRMKLMKLMYIIDQAALLRWGYAITGDEYVAMAHGPVLSQTYDNIRERPEAIVARFGALTTWASHIDSSKGNAVALRAPCDFAALSEAEVGLVEEVIAKHGRMTAKQLQDHTHTFPEWSDPSPEKAKDISIRDILEKNGVPEDDATGIVDDIHAFAMMERVFS